MSASDAAAATYWNGEPCDAERLTVTVGVAPSPTWWCADLAGQKRAAVRVRYGSDTFYLDDADGSGWRKVTQGHGSPSWPHRSLPVAEGPSP
jgi:hypothetical protein